MVRKLCAGLGSIVLIAATVILLGSPPAVAAGTVVVPGHNLAAVGLSEFRDSCSTITPNPPAAQQLGLRSGTIGSHSIGWQFGTGFEVGAMAPVFQPATLTTLGIDVYSPTGHARGHTVGMFYDTTPGYTGGYWIGFGEITLPGSGWIAWNLINVTMDWYYYDENGNYVETDPVERTLAGFASVRGGGSRAFIGAALGCDGEAFYVDRMRVSTAADQTVYDFEGAPSISGLYWYEVKKKKHKKKYVYHTDDLAVWYGTKFSLLGLGFDSATESVYAGSGSFWEKRGGGSYVRKTADSFAPNDGAWFNAKPKEQTTYAFVSDGTDWYDIDASNEIKVDVLARLNARINDRSLKPGQRAALTGKIAPGDRGTKVSLQRRVGNRWATVDSTRTGRGGTFGVSIKATRVGKMILRLKVASPRKGVGGAVSEWVLVSVTPRPKPKPPTNPGGGGGNSTQTETQTTAGTGTASAPAPTPDDTRVLARLVGQARPTGPVSVSAEPTCIMPGPYLVPCPPALD